MKTSYKHTLLLLAHLLTLGSISRVYAQHDNWAVIVSSSRFWLNYRHTTNALGVYQSIKRLGIPDSHIILMLADDSAYDPRNPRPGVVLASSTGPSWHIEPDIELDYRGREVDVSTVLQVLTGRHPAGTPASKRLSSTSNSSVLLYLTGHGGDGFLKFHDQDELLAADLASAVGQMHGTGRYGQLLVMLDTCQAATMYSRIAAPNWIGMASSKLGQSSYALTSDSKIGVHLVDEFSSYLVNFLANQTIDSTSSLDALVHYIKGQRMSSDVDVEVRAWGGRPLTSVKVSEFFSNAATLERGSKQQHGAVDATLELLRYVARTPNGQHQAEAAAAAGGGIEMDIESRGDDAQRSVYDDLLTVHLSSQGS